MPSHITVVPASTNAGKATIAHLLNSVERPLVRGMYRDPSKALAEFSQHPCFVAVKGDVGDEASLDFSGSDAVFFIPPPTYDGEDTGEWAERIARNVKNAILHSRSVKRLVLHSAVGAHHSRGIGVLRLNHICDEVLRSVVPEVLIVKPGWYHEMFADALKTMQADPPSFETAFSPADHQIPMVSVQDVGEFCSGALLAPPETIETRTVNLFGPRLYSSNDIKAALEVVIGKEGAMSVIKKEDVPAWFEGHVPKMYAGEFAELICSLLPGGVIAENFEHGDDTVRCKSELVDSFRRLGSE